MKINGFAGTNSTIQSPPSRRRGLKKMIHDLYDRYTQVASFAEAWIEKHSCDRTAARKRVASFAEAWIENAIFMLALLFPVVASFAEAWIENFPKFLHSRITRSPPSRRRGLKTQKLQSGVRSTKVASFAEAWIENWCISLPGMPHILSPPSRRRGLKRIHRTLQH